MRRILFTFLAVCWALGVAGAVRPARAMKALDLPREALKRPSQAALAEDAVRNPFQWRPVQGSGGVKVDLRLQGILWNSEHPLAIVNSKLVGVGDMIGGAMVVSITRTRVVFATAGGATKVLEFEPERIPVFQ